MKKSLVLTLAAVAVLGTAAYASCERPQVQSYAHPTLFGSQALVEVGAKTSSVVGGKITKCSNAKTVTGKENVVIKSFAKQELAKFEANSTESKFSHKSPVLRSELAQTLADGLELTAVKEADKYTDVPAGYWAKEAIDQTLAADIMIGYPDSSFKPEQRVTKAEVFCTLAKIFDAAHDKTATPVYNGKEIKHIPDWAVGATNEVLATGILDAVPDESALINNEYLSKEQVTYLVGALSQYLKKNPSSAASCVTSNEAPKYEVLIKLQERLSARVSNAGDTFTAILVSPATIDGCSYPAGAKIRGIVSEVVRPGVHNAGYIKVQFKEIVNGETVTKLPEVVTEAVAETTKDPNIVARLFGAPLSASARILGVAGRTVTQEASLTSNGVEQYGDNWSNAFCDTLCLQPKAGLKNVGSSFITVGKYIWYSAENVVSGVFGVCYEFVDEVRYLFAPKYSNNSSLNPKEVLKVTFENK
ncbi:MAG: S-layer homology domain-containing protein [Candidatus Gastranaerophilales bacterium]|nr:S-layer homology domain-containing protein [Candidatus Gastranaerophilales bacterium]